MISQDHQADLAVVVENNDHPPFRQEMSTYPRSSIYIVSIIPAYRKRITYRGVDEDPIPLARTRHGHLLATPDFSCAVGTHFL